MLNCGDTAKIAYLSALWDKEPGKILRRFVMALRANKFHRILSNRVC